MDGFMVAALVLLGLVSVTLALVLVWHRMEMRRMRAAEDRLRARVREQAESLRYTSRVVGRLRERALQERRRASTWRLSALTERKRADRLENERDGARVAVSVALNAYGQARAAADREALVAEGLVVERPRLRALNGSAQ